MKEQIVAGQAVSQGVFNLPWALLLPIGGLVATAAYTCVRALFRISALEEHNVEQDNKLEALSITANDTNTKVSRIAGYIDAKKEGTNA